MIVHPAEDAAEVVINDQLVGRVYWSLSDEPLVNVSVAPSALPLVLEWALEFGGEFRRSS